MAFAMIWDHVTSWASWLGENGKRRFVEARTARFNSIVMPCLTLCAVSICGDSGELRLLA